MSKLFSNGKCKIVNLPSGRRYDNLIYLIFAVNFCSFHLLFRRVVAVTNIKAGETILQEQPILLWSTNDQKRCSNCYQLTDQQCG